MPLQRCCVPQCNYKKGSQTAEDEAKVSYFKFPEQATVRNRWLEAAQLTENELTAQSRICSIHFDESQILMSSDGRGRLTKDAFPSKFAWNCEGNSVSHNNTNDPANECSEDSIISTSISELQQELLQEKKLNLELCATLKTLGEKLESLEKENNFLVESTASLRDQNIALQSRVFSLNSFPEDSDIAFYAGFPNRATFLTVFEFLDPGPNCENMRSIDEQNRPGLVNHPINTNDDEFDHDSEYTPLGRPHKLQPLEQFFLVLCRLKRGFSECHLGNLYGVSQSTISRIFVRWINFMYLKFGQICIWPSRQVVSSTMPEDFKEKYPSTRVIIDCTQIQCEMPSSLVLNSELFSSYKNHVTLKALIGIAPSGAMTFISRLYTGNISDREITSRCGFLNQQFDDGDSVMADKGFQIADILPLNVTLNILPFLEGNQQMSPEDVIKTQQIASLRIHVERAISKIKNFHIWDRVVPINTFGIVNQMWSVCAFLCNAQNPITSNELC